MLPGAAAVGRLPDAVAVGDVAADAGFAGADVDHAWIRGRDRDGAHRPERLLVGHRLPGGAAVGGLPHAAGDRAEIVGVGLAGNAGDRQHAPAAEGADEPPLHAVVKSLAELRLRGLRLCRRGVRRGRFFLPLRGDGCGDDGDGEEQRGQLFHESFSSKGTKKKRDYSSGRRMHTRGRLRSGQACATCVRVALVGGGGAEVRGIAARPLFLLAIGARQFHVDAQVAIEVGLGAVEIEVADGDPAVVLAQLGVDRLR